MPAALNANSHFVHVVHFNCISSEFRHNMIKVHQCTFIFLQKDVSEDSELEINSESLHIVAHVRK